MSGVTRVRQHRFGDEGGFVLFLVLLVVATLTVTVSGALLVTQSDYMTADAGVGATRAFHLAEAGLYRYMGQQTVPVDSVIYTMGGGTVVVRSAKVAVNGGSQIYEISSTATLTYKRGVERRTVRQFAAAEGGTTVVYQPIAAIATTARNVKLVGNYTGNDQAVSGSCQTAGTGNVAGLAAVAGGYIDVFSAAIAGSPTRRTEADTAIMRSRMNTQWQTLLDPATMFQYNVPAGPWPVFSTLPASQYPTVRVRGDFVADASRSGRGLLVVDGRLNLGLNFTWNGVIMAGDLVYPVATNAVIRGALVVGLAQTANASVSIGANATGSPRISFDACHVAASVRGTAGTFRLLRNTWSEPPGT